MLKAIQKIKEYYLLDNYSIILFFLVSLCFKNIYKFIIPLFLGLTLVQFYRFLKNETSKEYFFTTYFFLLIYSTVFYKSIQTIILIALLIFLFILYFKEKPKKILKNFKTEIYILIFFGLIALNLAIFEPHFKSLNKYLYLFLFPVVFMLLKKLSFAVDNLKSMRVFITSIVISSVLLLVFNAFDSNISTKTNTFFPKYLNLIHVYFGMFLGLATCFLFILFKEGTSYINTKVDLLIFVLFLTLLIHIGARISLLALLIVLVLLLFVRIPLPIIQKSALLLIFGSLFLILTYKTIPRVRSDIEYVKKVYTAVKNYDKEDLIHNSWRNIYQRFLVTSYTIDKIKDKPLLGIGLQNVKKTISDEIIKDGYLYFEPINSHNQYLHIWVGMGLFSFLFFLIMLFNFYKLQSYSIYFITFFLIIMLTESILVRVKGISLFFLFSLIFSFKENRI